MDLAPPGEFRAALVGRTIRLVARGWAAARHRYSLRQASPFGLTKQLCARREGALFCPFGANLHVVAYSWQTSVLHASARHGRHVLDAASYDIRWVLLSSASAAGFVRASDSDSPARRSCRARVPRP